MLVKFGNNETQGVQTNTQAQEKTPESRSQKTSEKQQKRNVIFAGELPFHKDRITLCRQEAQKKAMQLIQNAWDVDRKTDQSIAEYRERAEVKRKELQLNQEKIAECDARKENLRDAYGVEADSQEQKDLELLEKLYYPAMHPEGLTEEEHRRAQEMMKEPLTEYQQKCLEIEGEKGEFFSRAQNAENAIAAYNGAIRDMKIERLKFHKMTDAQNNAQKLMEQASEEIKGMLVEDAKDYVEETYEEQRETAEKEAEEKEAQEERIELRKEQRELMEERIEAAQQENRDAEKAGKERERDAREEAALLKDMADAGLNVAGASDVAQVEIKDMLQKMKLIEADIKGIEVDAEV